MSHLFVCVVSGTTTFVVEVPFADQSGHDSGYQDSYDAEEEHALDLDKGDIRQSKTIGEAVDNISKYYGEEDFK